MNCDGLGSPNSVGGLFDADSDQKKTAVKQNIGHVQTYHNLRNRTVGASASYRLLSEFQIARQQLPCSLGVTELPSQCPDWLHEHRQVYNDLKYFAKYFTSDKNRCDFLNGDGVGYNRLIVSIKRLQKLSSEGNLDAEKSAWLTGWLDLSLIDCPTPWQELPLEINHRNTLWVCSGSDRIFFSEDQKAKRAQESLGDFAPKWLKEFTLRGTAASEITLSYWNIRNSYGGTVTLVEFREQCEDLCRWLADFRCLCGVAEGLKALECKAIQKRLAFTDQAVKSLKLGREFTYSWMDIPNRWQVANRKRRFVVEPKSPLVDKPEKRVTRQSANLSVQTGVVKKRVTVSPETEPACYLRYNQIMDEQVEFHPLTIPPLQERGSVGGERAEQPQPERIDPYRIEIPAEMVVDVFASVCPVQELHGVDAVTLLRELSRKVVQTSGALPLVTSLTELAERLRVRVEQRYREKQAEVSAKKTFPDYLHSDCYEADCAELAEIVQAQDELSGLLHHVKNYIFLQRRDELSDTDEEQLSGEEDMDFSSGLARWQLPCFFLSMPLDRLAGVLTSPHLLWLSGKLRVPSNLLKVLGEKVNTSNTFVLVEPRRIADTLVRSIQQLVDVVPQVNSLGRASRFEVCTQSCQVLMTILLASYSQALRKQPDVLPVYCAMRQLSHEFYGYLALLRQPQPIPEGVSDALKLFAARVERVLANAVRLGGIE